MKQGDRVQVLCPRLFLPPRWRTGTVVSLTPGGKPRVRPDGADYVITVLKAWHVKAPTS